MTPAKPNSFHGISHDRKRSPGGRMSRKQVKKIKPGSSSCASDTHKKANILSDAGTGGNDFTSPGSGSAMGSPSAMLSNPLMQSPGLSTPKMAAAVAKFASMSKQAQARFLLSNQGTFVEKVAMVRGLTIPKQQKVSVIRALWNKQSEATKQFVRSVVIKTLS